MVIRRYRLVSLVRIFNFCFSSIVRVLFLLEFITESLAVREESEEIEDESGGAAFFSPLQLLIDMLDSAGNGSFLKIV